jgi:hypothetical protein
MIESKSKHAHMHTIVLAFMVLRRVMDFPIHVIGCSPHAPHPMWSSHGVFSLSLSLSHVRAGGRHWWSDREEHFKDFRYHVSLTPPTELSSKVLKAICCLNNLLWLKGNRDGLSYDHGHHHQPTKAEKCSFKDHQRWNIIWPFQHSCWAKHMSCMVSFIIFLKQFCDGAKVVIIHSFKRFGKMWL